MDSLELGALEAELTQDTLCDLRALHPATDWDALDDVEGEEAGALDVRLQVLDDGTRRLHSGDASYDTDHRGHWGAAIMWESDGEWEMIQIARDLVSQVMDSFAQVD